MNKKISIVLLILSAIFFGYMGYSLSCAVAAGFVLKADAPFIFGCLFAPFVFGIGIGKTV